MNAPIIILRSCNNYPIELTLAPTRPSRGDVWSVEAHISIDGIDHIVYGNREREKLYILYKGNSWYSTMRYSLDNLIDFKEFTSQEGDV